jgi:hypothetical protein
MEEQKEKRKEKEMGELKEKQDSDLESALGPRGETLGITTGNNSYCMKMLVTYTKID